LVVRICSWDSWRPWSSWSWSCSSWSSRLRRSLVVVPISVGNRHLNGQDESLWSLLTARCAEEACGKSLSSAKSVRH
jgi:hypothetical protein